MFKIKQRKSVYNQTNKICLTWNEKVSNPEFRANTPRIVWPWNISYPFIFIIDRVHLSAPNKKHICRREGANKNPQGWRGLRASVPLLHNIDIEKIWAGYACAMQSTPFTSAYDVRKKRGWSRGRRWLARREPIQECLAIGPDSFDNDKTITGVMQRDTYF